MGFNYTDSEFRKPCYVNVFFSQHLLTSLFSCGNQCRLSIVKELKFLNDFLCSSRSCEWDVGGIVWCCHLTLEIWEILSCPSVQCEVTARRQLASSSLVVIVRCPGNRWRFPTTRSPA